MRLVPRHGRFVGIDACFVGFRREFAVFDREPSSFTRYARRRMSIQDSSSDRSLGDELLLTDTLKRADLLRSALRGVALGAVAIAVPMGVRWAFGVVDLSYAIFSTLSLCLTLAVGFVPTTLVARRVLIRGGSLSTAALLGLASALPLMLVTYLGFLACQQLVPAITVLDPSEPRTVSYSVLTALADSLPWLVGWAGLVLTPALVHANALRQRAVATLMRDVELLRLRSHLEPHFVLNTMNAIAGLLVEDPAAARELLAMLGDIFRDATNSEERHTLDAELAWLARYIRIHELRFPDQLQTQWEIEEDARKCFVPKLLTQPLVENGLMHGALRVKSGVLKIRARVDAGDLIVEVRDNGPGLGPQRVAGKGIRLVERLLALEPTPGKLQLFRNGDETVVRVVVEASQQLGLPVSRSLV